jgi:hypothetical protein
MAATSEMIEHARDCVARVEDAICQKEMVISRQLAAGGCVSAFEALLQQTYETRRLLLHRLNALEGRP